MAYYLCRDCPISRAQTFLPYRYARATDRLCSGAIGRYRPRNRYRYSTMVPARFRGRGCVQLQYCAGGGALWRARAPAFTRARWSSRRVPTTVVGKGDETRPYFTTVQLYPFVCLFVWQKGTRPRGRNRTALRRRPRTAVALYMVGTRLLTRILRICCVGVCCCWILVDGCLRLERWTGWTSQSGARPSRTTHMTCRSRSSDRWTSQCGRESRGVVTGSRRPRPRFHTRRRLGRAGACLRWPPVRMRRAPAAPTP